MAEFRHEMGGIYLVFNLIKALHLSFARAARAIRFSLRPIHFEQVYPVTSLLCESRFVFH